MPKTKSNPKIETRLTPDQYQRLLQVISAEGISQAEFVRRATIAHLDELQRKNPSRREGALEKQLRKMEDRFASIMVRTGIDLQSMLVLLWGLHSGSDLEKEKRLKDYCYMEGSRRFRRRLNILETELKEEIARGSTGPKSKENDTP